MFALALARPTLAYVAISGISSLQIDYFNSIQATPSQSTLAMPRRSSSNSKKKSQLALYALAFVLTIIVLSIGKSFLNQQAQHFTDLNEMPLADLKESGTSLSGNEYRISGEIADRMILANNRGLLVSIKSETAQGKACLIPLHIPPGVNQINLERGHNYTFKVEVNREGLPVAQGIKAD